MGQGLSAISTLHANRATTATPEHDRGPTEADVTDSNLWGGASGHTYTFTRRPDGKTGVDVVVVREGKNLQGRLLAIAVGPVGNRVLAMQLGKTTKTIEGLRPAAYPTDPSGGR